MRRRLRILWGTLGAGIILFLVLGIVRCWPGRSEEVNSGNSAAAAAAATVVEHAGIGANANMRKKTRISSGSHETAKFSTSAPETNHSFSSSPFPEIHHQHHQHQQQKKQQQSPILPSSIPAPSIPRTTNHHQHSGIDSERESESRGTSASKRSMRTSSITQADLVLKKLDEL